MNPLLIHCWSIVVVGRRPQEICNELRARMEGRGDTAQRKQQLDSVRSGGAAKPWETNSLLSGWAPPQFLELVYKPL